MRLLVTLRATADATYDTSYHHNLRGRIWNAFTAPEYDEKHDSNNPVGYSYSNIFPWGDIQEGDERQLLIAAVNDTILSDIAADFNENPELNIGNMMFDIESLQIVEPYVGEPGTTGTIKTATGIACRIPPERAEEYGLDTTEARSGDTDTDLYWREEHGLGPLQDCLSEQLEQKHSLFHPDHLPGPEESDAPLFDSYEFEKRYPVKFTPSTGVTHTYLVSKWTFGYRVRDDDHRRHLNLALNTGLGHRTEHGFGFINITEKQTESQRLKHEVTTFGN